MSSFYQDSSIGNFINVTVVKIIILEDWSEYPEFNISTNADVTLRNFCKWQKEQNPQDDNHPHHYDVAILLTRSVCVFFFFNFLKTVLVSEKIFALNRIRLAELWGWLTLEACAKRPEVVTLMKIMESLPLILSLTKWDISKCFLDSCW